MALLLLLALLISNNVTQASIVGTAD